MNKSVLQDFLSLYDRESTKKVYNWAMNKFLRFVADRHGIDGLDEYLGQSRSVKDYQGDIRRFFTSIAGIPPKSQATIEGVLRAFFSEYHVGIPNQWWKTERRRSKRKRARALTADRIPSTDELRRILSHMPIQGKALFLVLSSGGMRIGDVVNIDMEDLNLNQVLDDGTAYHEILIFDQKTGNRRKVWVSEEAVEAINEWLKVRQEYLIQACGKCAPRRTVNGWIMFPHGKDQNDSRLFPFSTTNARAIWNNAIRSAEMDGRDRFTNRRKLHPHSLRKYYRTKRAGAGVPVDVIEADMGHEGYLTDAYRSYTDEERIRFYLQSQDNLSVFGATGELQSRLGVTENKLRALESELIGRYNLSRSDLIEIYHENNIQGVGGGKSIKAEWIPEMILERIEKGIVLDPLADLTEDELDALFIRAMRKKMLESE